MCRSVLFHPHLCRQKVSEAERARARKRKRKWKRLKEFEGIFEVRADPMEMPLNPSLEDTDTRVDRIEVRADKEADIKLDSHVDG